MLDFQEDLLKVLHTQYPDFKSSQVAEYVRNLFRDELVLSQSLQEEGPTPHLILDKTKTGVEGKEEPGEVTSGGGGIDWTDGRHAGRAHRCGHR